MFDQVEIRVSAGEGGDGAVSFRREKYIPLGGPDGGDGGDGGDVVLKVDNGVDDLRGFRGRKFYQSAHGDNGRGQKKHGKNGDDLILTVPIGTVVSEQRNAEVVIADLKQPGQEVVVAKGGRGGLGNIHFASSTNQTPQLAQKGESGEERSVDLEMRLIADVGIIGYPNVGKSTLLAAASAARPKIASYPFTTLEPILGLVKVGQQSLVLAEIPGLVDDAHLGRGLGHKFLRHIVRTKILLHLLDGSVLSPIEDMVRVNTELALFDVSLAQKPQMVVINKIDMPEVWKQQDEIKRNFSDAGLTTWFISAADGVGVPALMSAALEMLSRLVVEAEKVKPESVAVFRPRPQDATVKVHKDGDVFIVVAPRFERLVDRVDLTDIEVTRQLQGQLTKLGVSQALQKSGVEPGDKVRCGRFEWQY